MIGAKWVQHRSGIGEKWKVYQAPEQEQFRSGEFKKFYICVKDMISYTLPKSEYIQCDPPEEWVDVTKKYEGMGRMKTIELDSCERFRYIEAWHSGPCLIVERKK